MKQNILFYWLEDNERLDYSKCINGRENKTPTAHRALGVILFLLKKYFYLKKTKLCLVGSVQDSVSASSNS